VRVSARLEKLQLSARLTLAVLAVVAGVSVLARILLVREVPSAFFFMDELGYEQMAKSLARSGNLSLFGSTGSSYAPLYSVLLAPVYALTRSGPQAYFWAKIVNAVLMSLSVFAVYAIARFVLSRSRAIGVAALSLIAPLMFYSNLELSENLAYPLFLVAVWTMLRALRDPRPLNDALLLGAIALASAARLQNVALVPAALTAILIVAVVRPERHDEGRLRSVHSAIRAHGLLLGTLAVAAVAVLGRTIWNGGALPLSGRYAEVGSARANPLHVLEVALHHLAAFDIAVGVIPFAAALIATYALARLHFPQRALLFGAVAFATTLWLFFEVAFDAAAFDRSYVQHVGEQLPHDAARIHERYLIYLVPLFLVTMVAALRTMRPRIATRAHLVAAAVAVLLPLAIPFGTVVNDTSVAETFGLQILAKNVGGTILPYGHARLIALIVAGVLALAYLYALLRPRPSFAILVTVFAFMIMSSVVRVRIIGASQTIAIAPAKARWVDRAVGGSNAILVGGRASQRAAVVETAFDNLSISRVYYLCRPAFESGFDEGRLRLDADHALVDAGRTVSARYAVVPAALGIRGRVLARYRKGGLALVMPAAGSLTVSRRLEVCRSRH
jgi:hypothetical protein